MMLGVTQVHQGVTQVHEERESDPVQHRQALLHGRATRQEWSLHFLCELKLENVSDFSWFLKFQPSGEPFATCENGPTLAPRAAKSWQLHFKPDEDTWRLLPQNDQGLNLKLKDGKKAILDIFALSKISRISRTTLVVPGSTAENGKRIKACLKNLRVALFKCFFVFLGVPGHLSLWWLWIIIFCAVKFGAS